MAVVEDADGGTWAMRRGATILHLRIPGGPGRLLEKEARVLVPTAHVPVVVNSRCDVALAVGAAGVHLPEADISCSQARRLVGPRRLVGRSAHSLSSAVAAQDDGADYVVFGPVFETPTHAGREPLGLEALRAVCSALRVPVLAVGGVSGSRVAACAEAGAAGYAGIRGFLR